MYEKLIVPLDGSELAEMSLPVAAELSRRLHAGVCLVHVYESAGKRFQHVYESYMQKVADNLQAELARGDSCTAVEVTTQVMVGNSADMISEHAENCSNGLILMTSHGRSGIKRLALGSVISRTLRTAKGPVLTVKASEEAPVTTAGDLFRKILIALDGSDTGEAIMTPATEMAARLGMEVLLLRILPHSYRRDSGRGYDNVISAEKYLEAQSGQLRKAGIATGIEVRSGNMAREILKAAEENSCSMIAMTSRGRPGVRNVPLARVTEKILQETTLPMLLVASARPVQNKA